MTEGTVRVRTLREHNGPEGMKVAGDVYSRTAADAADLERRGIVKVLPPARRPAK